ncbi:MAG: response regulator transcription factor [Saccharofermentanales bacterium]
MFRLLIADDEPIVRKGLFDTLQWGDLGITVLDMAANGKEALEIAQKQLPDICLVDICMPIINGLDLIEKLKELNPEVIIIIVTGYDEFEYAQKAVQLKAFDYVLKPVYEENLRIIIENAIKELERTQSRRKSYEWAKEQLAKNLPLLKSKFILDWIKGELTREEISEQLEFHKIRMEKDVGFAFLKLHAETLDVKSNIQWEKQLLLFAIQNIFEEILSKVGDFNGIRDGNDNLVALVTIHDKKAWKEFKAVVGSSVEKYLFQKVTVYQADIDDYFEGVPDAYEEIRKEISNNAHCLPIVRSVKTYIERNYKNTDISLTQIAEELEVNSSYLSTLFKQEQGISFTDYLIKVRITEAIKLMNDTKIKIYEIAEEVGYSSQHYFCNSFKKVLGISPSEYRQKFHKSSNM